MLIFRLFNCRGQYQGGAGLYCIDKSSSLGRTIEVCSEIALNITCLGPVESEWNQRSFQVHNINNRFITRLRMNIKVRSVGCVGGRGNLSEEAMTGRDVVQFAADYGVSRRHFEVTISFVNPPNVVRMLDMPSIDGEWI